MNVWENEGAGRKGEWRGENERREGKKPQQAVLQGFVLHHLGPGLTASANINTVNDRVQHRHQLTHVPLALLAELWLAFFKSSKNSKKNNSVFFFAKTFFFTSLQSAKGQRASLQQQ